MPPASLVVGDLTRIADGAGNADRENDDHKAGFNPAQPRIPAGNPGGGRWTDSGGAGGGITDPRVISDATSDNDWKPGARYAQNRSNSRTFVILEDEPRFEHINSRHNAITDADLIDELKTNYYKGLTLYVFQPAKGSFADVQSANDLINQTLHANSELVDRVATGEVTEAALEHRFGYRTGKEAFRPNIDTDPYIRLTYSVKVIIGHESLRKHGYRLITAFPMNEKKRQRR